MEKANMSSLTSLLQHESQSAAVDPRGNPEDDAGIERLIGTFPAVDL
jgi:hypothetical protein